jgi:type I restriction enzyme S subunit
LRSLLNHPSVEAAAQELMTGQTRVRISMGRLRGLHVPVPPISLQNEFDNRISAIESLKAAHRAALIESDALFTSLQYRAFSGAL